MRLERRMEKSDRLYGQVPASGFFVLFREYRGRCAPHPA